MIVNIAEKKKKTNYIQQEKIYIFKVRKKVNYAEMKWKKGIKYQQNLKNKNSFTEG